MKTGDESIANITEIHRLLNSTEREVNMDGDSSPAPQPALADQSADVNDEDNNNDVTCVNQNEAKSIADAEADSSSSTTTNDCCVLNVEPLLLQDGKVTTCSEHRRDSIIVRTENSESKLDDFDTVSLSEPCCRVCQCNGSEEKLISPCRCCGSVKWIHESCLIQWMKSSLKDSCELCTKKIKITKRRKPLSKWKLPSQRPTPVLWVLVFVTAIALNLASVVKDASKLCSTTPCLVFYAVGCIGVILGTLFLVYWSKRAKVFINHWVELNEEWVIVVEADQVKEKTTNSEPNVQYSHNASKKNPNFTVNLNF